MAAQGIKVGLATSLIERLQGLLFTDYRDKVLLIAPCRSIHTIGMKYPIDVAFVDREGSVVQSEVRVGRRVMISNRRACAVLERHSDDTPWFEEGDRICIEGGSK